MRAQTGTKEICWSSFLTSAESSRLVQINHVDVKNGPKQGKNSITMSTLFLGQGAELFSIDPINGKIAVASCAENCLDYETVQAYYLSYSATDNNGDGKKTGKANL